MRNESVYLTLAQVLPTLLIALVLELRGGMRGIRQKQSLTFKAYKDLADAGLSEVRNALAKEYARRQDVMTVLYLVVGATFLLGEVAALSGPVIGLDGGFAWVAGPVALSATVVLGVFAVVLPILTFIWRADFNSSG
jgi:hypothetical protein